MRRACRFAIGAFALFYLAALAVLAIGTLGLFGSERDPLAGVFLVLLGQPWVSLIEVPEGYRLGFAILAPLANLAVLWLVCRRFSVRR